MPTILMPLLIFTIMLFNSLPKSSAQAASNPLRRVCIENGGDFEVYSLGVDDIALCHWGTAWIDAQSILSKYEGHTSQAALQIENGVSANHCADVGALDRSANGLWLCEFNDHSQLSLNTIKASPTNADRKQMQDILKKIKN